MQYPVLGYQFGTVLVPAGKTSRHGRVDGNPVPAQGKSIHAMAKELGVTRKVVRRALASSEERPQYQRAKRSKPQDRVVHGADPGIALYQAAHWDAHPGDSGHGVRSELRIVNTASRPRDEPAEGVRAAADAASIVLDNALTPLDNSNSGSGAGTGSTSRSTRRDESGDPGGSLGTRPRAGSCRADPA